MSNSSETLALLNVYEIVIEGSTRHFVCFLDPVLAGVRGIDQRTVVGEFTPGANRSFDPSTFRLNPEFVDSLTRYMNEDAALTTEVIRQAAEQPGQWLYVLDPRYVGNEIDEPNGEDLLGCFAVDGSGQIVPNSFMYNENHRWFEPDSGISGVFSDRRFYDWLQTQVRDAGSGRIPSVDAL
jgi:hypothetical protein